MHNGDFKALWDLLDQEYERRAKGKLTDLNHGGKISFAKKLQSDLAEWCDELAARAKAEFSDAEASHAFLKETVGERFDSIEPRHGYGTNFERAPVNQ
jgi:hypothetical protein